MGKMKSWLMDMEEDATKMSANEFRMQHGEEHMYIWETANGPESPDDKSCGPDWMESRKEEQTK